MANMTLVPHTFQNRLAGKLGEFWKKETLNQIEKVKRDLKEGNITIDENGVAYNCIGRVVMDDLAEVIEYVTPLIDRQATSLARADADAAFFEEYRKNPPKVTPEMYGEMRNAFGAGTDVVDIISGRVIHL